MKFTRFELNILKVQYYKQNFTYWNTSNSMAQFIYTFKKFNTSVLFQPSILHGSIIRSTTSRKNPLNFNEKTIIY